MQKEVSVRVPKEQRFIHSAYRSAAVATQGNQRAYGNANVHYFYCWESFYGEACLVILDEVNPTIRLYVNGSLQSTYDNLSPAVSGCLVYEVYFENLSYGDTYYATINGESFMDTPRVYRGGRGSAPTLSTTDSDIHASMSSPYNQSYSMAVGNLTFNSDYGTLNSYSRKARNLLYTSCLQYTEYDAILGKVGNFMSFWYDQWDEETQTFGMPSVFNTEAKITKFRSFPISVGLLSPSSSDYYSYFSGYINQWIDDVNTLLGFKFAVRDDSITQNTDNAISVVIGTHKDLFGYDPDGIVDRFVQTYFGQWSCTIWYPGYGAISHCEVKLCNELRQVMEHPYDFKNIVYEELTECLGCGNDTFETYESMFSEVWYIGKSNNLLLNGRATTDGEVVQMLYNELELGEPAGQVIHKLTPSEGAVIQLPNKKYGVSGNNYTVRAYSMNRQVTWDSDGYFSWDSSNRCFSDLGSSIVVTPSIFVGGIRPDPWYWSFKSGDSVPVDSYGIHPITADEWNRFTERINEFRVYAGYHAYNFTTVSSHQNLTPAIYNQAVNAIKGVSGYGSWVDLIDNTTIAIQDSKFRIYLFDTLASEANAIGGYV